MLYHTLAMPGRGVDIEQITMMLDEQLDVVRFMKSWEVVVKANPILRSSFDWTSGHDPIRQVNEDVALDCDVRNWEDVSHEAQVDKLKALADEDRTNDFKLDTPPLMRFYVVRLGPRQWLILWSFHHILLDGRSFPMVLRQVFDHYDSGKRPLDTADFSLFVNAQRDIDHQAARPHFERLLADLEPAKPISFGNRDPQSSDFSAVERRLSNTTTNRLREIAETSNVSLNNVVQAAWGVFQHRHDQRDTVVFGSTRANRHLTPDAHETIGLLINTLPFRVDIDRSTSVVSLLQQISRTHRAMRDVESTPLPLVQSWSGVSAGGALFQSLVMYDDATLDTRMRECGWPHRRFEYRGQTNFPLALISYGEPELSLRLEHACSYLDSEGATAAIDRLVTIFEAIAARGANCSVGDLDYISTFDKARLTSWNNTDVDTPPGETLVSLFSQQVRKTPDAPALKSGDTVWTYAELDSASNRLSQHLMRIGVKTNSVVGVLVERSIDVYLATYAILKCGAAYLPLDPEYPEARLNFMLEDTSADALFCTDQTQDLASRLFTGPIVNTNLDIDTYPDEIAKRPATDSPAYVIYTSGSTGTPKGVINEHQGIANRLLWMQRAFELGESDVVLHKTPFTFDVSVWELFWPLQVGAAVSVLPADEHRDSRALIDHIIHSGVTTLHFVPSMLALFLEDSNATKCQSLRRVICSGEALQKDTQDRFFSTINAELHNLYGPTEAAIDVTWWPCDRQSKLPFVPIGYPIANTQVHVLDNSLQPTPPGIPGELCIGGVQVARGYLNRPELNAERFVDNPFAEGRIYRTGDLCRHLPDGTLEYLGRTDHQIKLRGFRIELGEIEVALSSHAKVRHCVVIDQKLITGATHLVAYYVADEAIQAEDLREHLSSRLADYMVPTLYMELEAIPLSANGKVDRKNLPAPTLETNATETARTEPEREVSAIWSKLLNLPDIDRTVPFFDAGGDSLLAVRLATHVSDLAGREISVAEVLSNPTIASQAELVSTAENTSLDGARERAMARRAAQRRRVTKHRRS